MKHMYKSPQSHPMITRPPQRFIIFIQIKHFPPPKSMNVAVCCRYSKVYMMLLLLQAAALSTSC